MRGDPAGAPKFMLHVGVGPAGPPKYMLRVGVTLLGPLSVCYVWGVCPAGPPKKCASHGGVAPAALPNLLFHTTWKPML